MRTRGQAMYGNLSQRYHRVQALGGARSMRRALQRLVGTQLSPSIVTVPRQANTVGAVLWQAALAWEGTSRLEKGVLVLARAWGQATAADRERLSRRVREFYWQMTEPEQRGAHIGEIWGKRGAGHG
jgi:hypothetical protein